MNVQGVVNDLSSRNYGVLNGHIRNIITMKGFVENPKDCMMHVLINNIGERAGPSSEAIMLVLKKIDPKIGFVEFATSVENLQKFAVTYFANHPNKEKIMQVFQESLNDSEFLGNLQLATNSYKKVNFNDKDCEDFNMVKYGLEHAFAIFRRSEQLQPFGSYGYERE